MTWHAKIKLTKLIGPTGYSTGYSGALKYWLNTVFGYGASHKISPYLNSGRTERQFIGCKHGGTANLIDLLGPLALLRSRFHHDAVIGSHVMLHR